MARQTRQSSEFKFTVEQRPLMDNGKAIGFYGNFRLDTGACLGVTSEQYTLTQNEELIEAAHGAFDQRHLEPTKSRVVVTGDGEKFFAEFQFGERTLETQVGDTFGYVLTIKNSFDLSTQRSVELSFRRLVCDNGASTLEREFAMASRHIGKTSVEFVGKAIDRALSHGADALAVYDEMARTKITPEQGQHILAQLEHSKLLSGSLRAAMETLWLSPRRREDKARNLYNLYNAVTEHLTHEVSKERFEYASKVSRQVLLTLVNASRNPTTLGKLIVPVTIASK